MDNQPENHGTCTCSTIYTVHKALALKSTDVHGLYHLHAMFIYPSDKGVQGVQTKYNKKKKKNTSTEHIEVMQGIFT